MIRMLVVYIRRRRVTIWSRDDGKWRSIDRRWIKNVDHDNVTTITPSDKRKYLDNTKVIDSFIVNVEDEKTLNTATVVIFNLEEHAINTNLWRNTSIISIIIIEKSLSEYQTSVFIDGDFPVLRLKERSETLEPIDPNFPIGDVLILLTPDHILDGLAVPIAFDIMKEERLDILRPRIEGFGKTNLFYNLESINQTILCLTQGKEPSLERWSQGVLFIRRSGLRGDRWWSPSWIDKISQTSCTQEVNVSLEESDSVSHVQGYPSRRPRFSLEWILEICLEMVVRGNKIGSTSDVVVYRKHPSSFKKFLGRRIIQVSLLTSRGWRALFPRRNINFCVWIQFVYELITREILYYLFAHTFLLAVVSIVTAFLSSQTELRLRGILCAFIMAFVDLVVFAISIGETALYLRLDDDKFSPPKRVKKKWLLVYYLFYPVYTYYYYITGIIGYIRAIFVDIIMSVWTTT